MRDEGGCAWPMLMVYALQFCHLVVEFFSSILTRSYLCVGLLTPLFSSQGVLLVPSVAPTYTSLSHMYDLPVYSQSHSILTFSSYETNHDNLFSFFSIILFP